MIPVGILAAAARRNEAPDHDLVDEYLTAEELTHDWADLGGWDAIGVQVYGNALYGVSGGNPVAAGHSFAVPANQVVKVTAEIENVAGNAGTQYVGINFGGAGNGVLPSLPGFVGIGIGSSTRRPAFWIGSNFSGVPTGNTFISSESLAAGRYRATVVADEQNISLVLQSQDGSKEWVHTLPRSAAPNGGEATSIIVWNGATNGTSGSSVRAIGAKKSLTPFRTKSNAAGIIEGNTSFVLHRDVGDKWRIQLPENINGMQPVKVVLFLHQASTGDRNSPLTESRWSALRTALMENGYALLSADDIGDRWGTPASVANYTSLVNWLRSKVYTGDLCLVSHSMGGLPLLNSIAHGELSPAAVTLICPVCDLVAMRSNPSFTDSIDAAWDSTSEASLITNSAGYNPMTSDKSLFGGVAYQFNVGASDPVVPAEEHTELFAPSIEPYAASVEVNVLGTGHGPVECFDPLVIVPHFNENTQ